jgi:hypothetical protein
MEETQRDESPVELDRGFTDPIAMDRNGSNGEGPALSQTPATDAEAVRKIKDLPKEVGVMLISVGVLGFVLPGVMGTPAIIAGGLVLWPKAFGKVEDWFERRYPALHRKSMKQIGRYLDDLERRFPDLSEK